LAAGEKCRQPGGSALVNVLACRRSVEDLAVVAALALAGAIGAPHRTGAQASEPFVGEVITVAFNFCPAGWLPLNGQLLPIRQYQVLFSLLGTTYGGDGISTFALPTAKPIFTADNHTTILQCISLFGVYPPRN
jgi:microcystin-dependent protein